MCELHLRCVPPLPHDVVILNYSAYTLLLCVSPSAGWGEGEGRSIVSRKTAYRRCLRANIFHISIRRSTLPCTATCLPMETSESINSRRFPVRRPRFLPLTVPDDNTATGGSIHEAVPRGLYVEFTWRTMPSREDGGAAANPDQPGSIERGSITFLD